MIRSDGEGSPWRRCSFTKSASAREAAAVTGETKSEDGAAALCDGHHGASRGGGGECDSIIPLFFSSNCPASRVTWFCARTQGFKELCFKDHSSSFAKHCMNYKTDLLKVRFCPVFPLLKIILTSPKKLINR